MLVHIVDDDPAIARTIARGASRAGWETAVYDSADAFLTQLEMLPFGCVVTDINMPGTSGLQLLQAMSAKRPDWPVIMMTGFGEIGEAIRSFRQGAIHFLQKPFRQPDLLSALREAGEIGARRVEESRKRRESEIVRTLSQRETEVLAALADGLQSKAIAFQLGISTRTVEMHRSNILAKLGARNTSQAVGLYRSSPLR